MSWIRRVLEWKRVLKLRALETLLEWTLGILLLKDGT